MILERLIKLNERKRISLAVLAILAVACVCYAAITRNSVVKLQTANANYTGIRTAYAIAENQQAGLLELQNLFRKKETQLQECRQRYFSVAEALRFFENINAMALAYNLKPISGIVSEPKEFVSEKEAKPKLNFLKTQSAKIIVAGSYFDIIDFLNEFADRPQKVSITNLHIALPPGEEFYPKASFEISLIMDSSMDEKK
jgi:Tfp pilus assembly protein PilO